MVRVVDKRRIFICSRGFWCLNHTLWQTKGTLLLYMHLYIAVHLWLGDWWRFGGVKTQCI